MRKKIQNLVLGIIGIGITYLLIRADYRWEAKITEDIKHSDSSYFIYYRYSEWLIARPWTWFKKRPVSVSFTRQKDCGRINSQYYYSRSISFIRDQDENINPINYYIIDVTHDRFCSLSEKEFINIISDIEKIRNNSWQKMSTWENIRSLKKHLLETIKPIYILDAFGRPFEISSAIASGEYKVNGEISNDSVCTSITNNNPIKITDSYYPYIRAAVINEDKKDLDWNKIFESVRYDRTVGYMKSIADIYVMNIDGDTLEFSFKWQIFGDPRNDKEIVILKDQ